MHVLSTPPAFVLSQDQTLHKIYNIENLISSSYYLLLTFCPLLALCLYLYVSIPVLVTKRSFFGLSSVASILCLVFKDLVAAPMSTTFCSLYILAYLCGSVKSVLDPTCLLRRTYCRLPHLPILCQDVFFTSAISNDTLDRQSK